VICNEEFLIRGQDAGAEREGTDRLLEPRFEQADVFGRDVATDAVNVLELVGEAVAVNGQACGIGGAPTWTDELVECEVELEHQEARSHHSLVELGCGESLEDVRQHGVDAAIDVQVAPCFEVEQAAGGFVASARRAIRELVRVCRRK
jgi:hypothetical protein